MFIRENAEENVLATCKWEAAGPDSDNGTCRISGCGGTCSDLSAS